MSNKMLTLIMLWLTFSLREERELERKFYFTFFYCCRFFVVVLPRESVYYMRNWHTRRGDVVEMIIA